MSFTNYLETDVLKYAFTTDSTSRSTTWFTALYTVAPTDAGNDGTEVTTVGTGYARQATAFSVTASKIATATTVPYEAVATSYSSAALLEAVLPVTENAVA